MITELARTIPDPSTLFSRIDEIIAEIDTSEWNTDPPVNAGSHINPNLQNLPAYTLEWRERGESDNARLRHVVEGTFYLRIYVQIPLSNPDVGDRVKLSLHTAIKQRIITQNTKSRLRLGRVAVDGVINETVPGYDTVSALRADYSVKLY